MSKKMTRKTKKTGRKVGSKGQVAERRAVKGREREVFEEITGANGVVMMDETAGEGFHNIQEAREWVETLGLDKKKNDKIKSKNSFLGGEEVELGSRDKNQEVDELVIIQEETGFWQKIRNLNSKLPWLKIVLLLVLVAGVAFGVEELLRHNVGTGGKKDDVGMTEEVPDQDLSGGTQEEPGVEEQPKDEQKAPEDEPKPEEDTKPYKPNGDTLQSGQTTGDYTGKKLVAITFDDGPSAVTTPRLLDILKEKKAKATFFVVGNMAIKNTDLLKREYAEGHEVGSHTMTHANLGRSTVAGIQWEEQAMDNLFVDVLGARPAITRPPYGEVNDTVRSTMNQPLIIWTVDTEDWRYRDATSVRSRAMAGVFDGAIILMHDIHSTTVDAVGAIIDDLRAAGYELVTVSEMAKIRGVSLQNGYSYGSFRI